MATETNSSPPLLIVNLYAENVADLPAASDYAAAHVRGELARLEGTEDVVLLGRADRGQSMTLCGTPAVGLVVFASVEANELETARRVKETMKGLKPRFPPGLDYVIEYDSTEFVRDSIHHAWDAVRDTFLVSAVAALVLLGDWRAAIVAMMSVLMCGSSAIVTMTVFGFSVNNISLLGLAISVAIVAGDAIRTVDGIRRRLGQGMSPRVAAQVPARIGAVAMSFGLVAALLPTAFVAGVAGTLYRQLTVPIGAAALISACNTFDLIPLLTATLLATDNSPRKRPARRPAMALAWLSRVVNTAIDRMAGGGEQAVQSPGRRGTALILVPAGIAAVVGFALVRSPALLVPPQDKGHLLVDVQLEEPASPERTRVVTRHVEAIALRTRGVAHTVAISGHSFLHNTDGAGVGSAFLVLDSHDRRSAAPLRAESIAAALRETYRREIPGALIGVHGLPPRMAEWSGAAHTQRRDAVPAWFLPLCTAVAALALLANTSSRQAALSVLLIAPVGAAVARLGIGLAGFPNDLCTQAAFVVLVGLACRNAVLVTESAALGRETRPASEPQSRAAVASSLVFLAAMIPVAIDGGTGAELRRPSAVALLVGVTVITCGGWLAATMFARTPPSSHR